MPTTGSFAASFFGSNQCMQLSRGSAVCTPGVSAWTATVHRHDSNGRIPVCFISHAEPQSLLLSYNLSVRAEGMSFIATHFVNLSL